MTWYFMWHCINNLSYNISLDHVVEGYGIFIGIHIVVSITYMRLGGGSLECIMGVYSSVWYTYVCDTTL